MLSRLKLPFARKPVKAGPLEITVRAPTRGETLRRLEQDRRHLIARTEGLDRYITLMTEERDQLSARTIAVATEMTRLGGSPASPWKKRAGDPSKAGDEF